MDKKSIFATLNAINVNDKTEKKGKLTYLSWAWAWARVKELYPLANYTIYENKDGWNYFTDGRTAWVKTGVTIEGLEHIEYLPIMDNYNKSIPLDKITSFNVNTSIQRSLTKAVARHGLGLYIYAGEDLPEVESTAQPKEFENDEVANLKHKQFVDNYFYKYGHESQVDPFLKRYNISYLDELEKRISLKDYDNIITGMKLQLQKEGKQW